MLAGNNLLLPCLNFGLTRRRHGAHYPVYERFDLSQTVYWAGTNDRGETYFGIFCSIGNEFSAVGPRPKTRRIRVGVLFAFFLNSKLLHGRLLLILLKCQIKEQITVTRLSLDEALVSS